MEGTYRSILTAFTVTVTRDPDDEDWYVAHYSEVPHPTWQNDVAAHWSHVKAMIDSGLWERIEEDST